MIQFHGKRCFYYILGFNGPIMVSFFQFQVEQSRIRTWYLSLESFNKTKMFGKVANCQTVGRQGKKSKGAFFRLTNCGSQSQPRLIMSYFFDRLQLYHLRVEWLHHEIAICFKHDFNIRLHSNRHQPCGDKHNKNKNKNKRQSKSANALPK